MSLTYTTYVSQLSNLMVVPSTNAEFQIFLPGCIDYAEQRIYRELDILATSVIDSTTMSSGIRTLSLPTTQGEFLVVESVNVITPVTGTLANGTRNPCTPVNADVLDAIYPSQNAFTGVPELFARFDSSAIIVGPAPDRAYLVEIRGTQRPTALSSANTTTVLTTYFPDLFLAASMVFASGYMRNFGAQADNPQMSQSWETQYRTLFESAAVEEARKTFESAAWTYKQPTPMASPPPRT